MINLCRMEIAFQKIEKFLGIHYVNKTLCCWKLTNAAATPMAIFSLVLQFKGVFRGSAKS